MGMQMSEAAKSALINGGKGINASTEVIKELKEAGLIGPYQGVTRKGEIQQMKLRRAAEDAAFGA